MYILPSLFDFSDIDRFLAGFWSAAAFFVSFFEL